MLKTLFQLEHAVEQTIQKIAQDGTVQQITETKSGRFIFDHDTSLSSIKEILFQFQKYIGQEEDKAKAQQAAFLAAQQAQSEEKKSNSGKSLEVTNLPETPQEVKNG